MTYIPNEKTITEFSEKFWREFLSSNTSRNLYIVKDIRPYQKTYKVRFVHLLDVYYLSQTDSALILRETINRMGKEIQAIYPGVILDEKLEVVIAESVVRFTINGAYTTHEGI